MSPKAQNSQNVIGKELKQGIGASHYVPSPTLLHNTYMAKKYESFSSKEIRLGAQVGSTKNGAPTWALSSNY